MTGKLRFAGASQVNVITADDAQDSIITAKTSDGIVGFGVKNKELSKLAALLIQQSEKVASAINEGSLQVDASPRQHLTLAPIQSSSVGIGKGVKDWQTTLVIGVGNMTLAFSVDTSTLQQICADLQNIDKLSKPSRTQ